MKRFFKVAGEFFNGKFVMDCFNSKSMNLLDNLVSKGLELANGSAMFDNSTYDHCVNQLITEGLLKEIEEK